MIFKLSSLPLLDWVKEKNSSFAQFLLVDLNEYVTFKIAKFLILALQMCAGFKGAYAKENEHIFIPSPMEQHWLQSLLLLSDW